MAESARRGGRARPYLKYRLALAGIATMFPGAAASRSRTEEDIDHGLERTQDRRSARRHGNQHVRLRNPQVIYDPSPDEREPGTTGC